MATTAHVHTVFDHGATNTATHIVSCPTTKRAAIIDAVLNFTLESASCKTESVDKICKYVDEEGLIVDWIMDTHVHADHLTAMAVLKHRFPDAKTAIGGHIADVQHTFGEIFNTEEVTVKRDGSQFDRLWTDQGDQFSVGNLKFIVIHTPGHTPACVSYYCLDDCIFTGDSIFMPDMGTARCDFPQGSAETLWNSVQKILALPEHVRCFVGHDYGPGGRDIAWETTIGTQKSTNKHVKKGTTREEFVKIRTERDKQLNVPKLLLPSVQVNIRAGHLPAPERNGTSYLKLPVNIIDPKAAPLEAFMMDHN